MTSEAQIRANRLNAVKSTGPKTARGKAMMRDNAVKHGMTAKHVVLFDEVKEEFETFYAGLTQDFAPEGTAECALVERIAMLAWRLRRTSRAEAAMVNGEAEYRRERIAEDGPHNTRRLDTSIMFDRLVDSMGTLTRYEASMDRQLNRAIALLERLQAQRSERDERAEEALEDPPHPAEMGPQES